MGSAIGTIVTLTGDDLEWVRELLADARSVRVAIDGGFKVSADRGVWTPPLGSVDEGT